MFKKFLKSKAGATSIEYAIIASMVSVAVIGGVTALGEKNEEAYNDISAQVDSASN